MIYTYVKISNKHKMHITDIPTDLIPHIAQFLPYSKCTLLLVIYKDCKAFKEAFKHLFANCELFDALLQNALNTHNISPSEFYDLLKYQSINVHHIFNLLRAVSNNSVTPENKTCYKLAYNSIFVTPIALTSTTKVTQIMLTMVDHYAQDETKIINNPYHYIHTYINDTLLNYFIDVITRKFRTPDIKSTQHFKLFKFTVYTNYWYKSNFNLYIIFCLYLANLGIIRYKYAEILRISASNPRICNSDNATDNVLSFMFDFLQLFSANQWLAILFTTLISYITSESETGTPILNDYQTNACMYIYDQVMEASDITVDIKNNLTAVAYHLLCHQQ